MCSPPMLPRTIREGGSHPAVMISSGFPQNLRCAQYVQSEEIIDTCQDLSVYEIYW